MQGYPLTFRAQSYGYRVDVVWLSPALGAQIVGIDITKPLPADVQVELRRLFMQHHLLLVRAKTDPGRSRSFRCLFRSVAGAPGGRRRRIRDEPHGRPRSLFAEMRPLIWHNDGAYGPRPGIATSLWAVELAPSAVPTLFANVNDIVDRLPASLLEQAERLHVLNVRDTEFDRTYERVPSAEIRSSPDPSRYVTYEHPVLFEPAPLRPHGYRQREHDRGGRRCAI